MILTQITLENFKNYEKASLSFFEGINCFAGPNGAGKTNMLDAIYYLSTGKSYFNPIDAQLIYGNAEYFSLKGSFENNGNLDNVLCVSVKGRKKVIKLNDEQYDRIIDHYGGFPVVMVAPADLELITGGSEERRKWLDSTISWVDKSYLLALVKYDKILQQRNAELRKMEFDGNEASMKLIKVYDEMMVPVGEEIYKSRNAFMALFLPFFMDYHGRIAENKETVSLQYMSAMHTERFSALLENSLKKDMVLQRTNVGPHRDDIEFLIEKIPLKRFGSQGQQKTFLLALKLAQHQYLKTIKGNNPILLLDDISERLDGQRLAILFRLILERDKFGQVFVTDTSMDKLGEFLDSTSGAQRYKVENGIINHISTND